MRASIMKNEFESAKAQGFLLNREDGDRARKLHSQYYGHCELAGIPFVEVKVRGKHGGIRADLICLPRNCLSSSGQALVQALLEEYGVRGSRYAVGMFTYVDRVPAERMGEFATKLRTLFDHEGILVAHDDPSRYREAPR